MVHMSKWDDLISLAYLLVVIGWHREIFSPPPKLTLRGFPRLPRHCYRVRERGDMCHLPSFEANLLHPEECPGGDKRTCGRRNPEGSHLQQQRITSATINTSATTTSPSTPTTTTMCMSSPLLLLLIIMAKHTIIILIRI